MGHVDEPMFPAYLDKRHSEVMKFLSNYSDLTIVIDTALMITHALVCEAVLHNAKSMAKTYCGLMWQTAADYHKQSLAHILARELDAGFALLRMATELSRDAYVIANNEQHLDLWMNRETRAGEYRNLFKFDQSIPGGKAAFDLYKLSSRFGIHGHNTSLMHSKSTGETVANGKLLLINSDEKAVFSGMQIWIRAIFSIHELFCNAFKLNEAPIREPYVMFIKFIESLEPILEAVDKKVGRKPKMVH